MCKKLPMANRWRANKSVIHSPTCSTWIRGVTPPALVITGTLIRIIDDEIEHPGQQNWRPRNPLRARHQSGVPTLRATHVAAVSGRATNTRKESRMPVMLQAEQDGKTENQQRRHLSALHSPDRSERAHRRLQLQEINYLQACTGQ